MFKTKKKYMNNNNVELLIIDHFPLLDEKRHRNMSKDEIENLNNFIEKTREKLLLHGKPIPSDISKIIDEHFWEMI